jgi:hypothetical protein
LFVYRCDIKATGGETDCFISPSEPIKVGHNYQPHPVGALNSIRQAGYHFVGSEIAEQIQLVAFQLNKPGGQQNADCGARRPIPSTSA